VAQGAEGSEQVNERTRLARVIRAGKADEWSKAQGGFAVYRLSNGDIDYFPTGQPPNIAGERDRAALRLARFSWNHVRWSRLD
jgi:hypothetical protein